MESDIIKDTTVLLTRRGEVENSRSLTATEIVMRQYAQGFQVRKAELFNAVFGGQAQSHSKQTNKLLLEAL